MVVMRLRAFSCSSLLLIALGAAPALAQDPRGVDAASQETAFNETNAEAPASPLDEDSAPLEPLSAAEIAQLAEMLSFDAAVIDRNRLDRPAPALRMRGRNERGLLKVTGNGANGEGTVVVTPTAPLRFDTKVGADLGTAVVTSHTDRTVYAMPATRDGSGAAWASVGVTDFATLDARVDPVSDHGRLGTTFSKSVPVGRSASVTLVNSYAVTGKVATPSPQDAASQVWHAEQSVRFNLGSTGTTLGAGVHTNTADTVVHNTLSAEQRIAGPLHISTAVSDIGQPSVSRRISAGFRVNW